MHPCKTRGPAAALCLALSAGTLPALAAGNYLQTWDTDEGGWVANTVGATVSNPGVDGNPGGFLRSDTLPQPNGMDIGATTEVAAATGSFAAGVWTVDVDLQQIAGTIGQVWLRFRYQDSSHNGWMILLNDGPTGDGWVTRTVSFDAGWSDADALLNGWVQEAGPNASFADTLASVYRTEVRFSSAPVTAALAVGIDNFRLTGPAPIPEPSTYALMALGLAAVAGAVRRRRR